jgi:hypothetical protein
MTLVLKILLWSHLGDILSWKEKEEEEWEEEEEGVVAATAKGGTECMHDA